MYHFLIIDDELERRESAYKELLEPDFVLSFIGKPDLVVINNAIDNPDIKAIILDMVLDWDKKGSQNHFDVKEAFEFMLKIIGKKKPVIIISRNLSYVASWLRGNKTGENDIIDFFGWDEIWNEDNTIKDKSIKNSFCLRIEWVLNDFFQKTQSLKGPNDTVTLLHITDLQFGDPDFTKNSLFSETILARSLLNEFDLRPDFIAITGDITYSGLPSQFDLAKEWLTGLVSELFPEDFKLAGERILLIPGNHDVNLVLSSVDAYDYNFGNVDNETGIAKSQSFLIHRNSLIYDHKSFGLMPFCNFAYSITQDKRWLERLNDLCWINDKFLGWGLRFVHLNSVAELDCKYTSKISFSEDSLKKLGKENESLGRPEFYTVYLCHNGPYDLGLEVKKESSTNFINLCGLVNIIGCDLFLHGHLHENFDEKYNVPINDPKISKIPFVQTGTLNLNSKSRRQDSRRGFSIVEFYRENHIVSKVELSTFELENYTIRLKKKTLINKIPPHEVGF